MTPRQIFASQGFVHLKSVVSQHQIPSLISSLDILSPNRVGTRNVLDHNWCLRLVDLLRSQGDLITLLPQPNYAIQCILFSKSQESNWLVPWHQDLSIPVLSKVDHAQLSGWSLKEGIHYVHLPADILKQLVVVRVHLDPCDQANGALQVVPGSHTQSHLDPQQVLEMKPHYPESICVAEAGDALVLSPLLLHRSSKSKTAAPRRVLHFVFGPISLPWGLKWKWQV